MIRLGLHLTFAGGKEAVIRLCVIAAGVMLGVGLLLASLAAVNATTTQNARNAWLNTGTATSSTAASAPASAATATLTADPLWWLVRADYFDGRLIGRVDVAATGPRSPVPPGLPRLPGPGEYYASPALAALLRSAPAGELADRYPGRRIGTLGAAALPGPDSLLVVVGRTPAELSRAVGARRVGSITAVPPSSCNGTNCTVIAGTDANGMALILSVVAVALIFPLMIMIGTATRLSAARREQRFAAMRLVGATPRQISVISGVESATAAVAGVAGGFGLFFVSRPLLAMVHFTELRFFPSDLALEPSEALAVAVGIPVAAAVAAHLALRRVRISPLGVTRRVTPRPPRAYRLIPLAAGLGELAYFIGRRPATTAGQVQAFATGALLVLAGIVIAGPWLTMAGARLMAQRTGAPALLLAGRRLSDNPKAGFRAVSGLVLALCVTSGTIGVITTMNAERGLPKVDAAAGPALIDNFYFSHGRTPSGEPIDPVAAPSDAVLARLRSISGVRGVTVIHTNPLGTKDPLWNGPSTEPPIVAGLASCAELASMPVFGRCPAGAAAVSVTPVFNIIGLRGFGRWPDVWPAAAISAERLRGLPVGQIVVATDGSTAAIEQARTVLGAAYPHEDLPRTVADEHALHTRELASYQRLAEAVILISFPIAGCSLAMAVAGGLSDRKRPFSLLRLAGVPLGPLRRVVLLESAVPLVAVAAVAIGTGFLAAHLFLKAQLGYAVMAPPGDFWVLVLAGLAASLGVIAATLPLLRQITGPETARNE